ncbi:MAG: hypothetical protein BIFFINMI_02403 [Phycisphaerae bacterium]|nr:hypothetical protein [Phycisphaerae bacterium]
MRSTHWLIVTILLALAAATTIGLPGCAKYYYSEGQDYLAAKKYDSAIESFSKAVEEDPEEPLYQQALADAKNQAATYYLTQAGSSLAGHRLATATSQANRALSLRPGDAQATALLAQINDQRGQAEAKRTEARSLTSGGQFDAALAKMREAMAIDAELPGGQSDANAIVAAAVNFHLAAARTAVAAAQWDQAETSARNALTYDRNNVEANQVLTQVTKGREADRLVGMAQAAIASGRLEDALNALTQADQLNPGQPRIAALLQTTKQSVCDQYLTEGDQLATAGKAADALAAYNKSKQLLPGYGEVDARMDKVRKAVAATYKQAATNAFWKQQWMAALVDNLLANGYAAGTVGDWVVRDCVVKLNERVRFNAGLVAGTRRNDPACADSAARIEQLCLDQIAQVRPDAAAILSPRDMKQLLASKGLLAANMVGPAFEINAPKLAELGLVGSVEVTRVIVNTASQDTLEKVQYQEGVQKVDNPDYAKALAARDAAATQVNTLQAQLTSLQQQRATLQKQPQSSARDKAISQLNSQINTTTSRLNSAKTTLNAKQQALNNTPAKVDQAIDKEYTYPAHIVTRTAQVTLTLKLMDPAGGRMFVNSVINGDAQATDRQVDADAKHHVPGDPLTLPDEKQMRLLATAQACTFVLKAMEDALYARAGSYLLSARAAEQAGRNDQAVEDYGNFLFARPFTDAETESAFQSLDRLTAYDRGIVTLRDLLTAAAPVLRPINVLQMTIEQRDDGLWVQQIPGLSTPNNFVFPAQLLTVTGVPTRTPASIAHVLSRSNPGDAVVVEVMDKDGKPAAVRMTVLVHGGN